MEKNSSVVSLELAQRLIDGLQRDRRALEFVFRVLNFTFFLSSLFAPSVPREIHKLAFFIVGLVVINLIWVMNVLNLRRKISESISVIARSSYEQDPDFFRSIIELREAERFSSLGAIDVYEPLLWAFLTIVAATLFSDF